MNLCGRECRVLNVLIVGVGVRIRAGQFNFFFFAFSFLKQYFKKGFNIKNTLSTEVKNYFEHVYSYR